AARNARSSARTNDRREHGLLRRRPAARRARGGSGRKLVERAVLGHHRRHRLSPRNSVDYRHDTGAAPISDSPAATLKSTAELLRQVTVVRGLRCVRPGGRTIGDTSSSAKAFNETEEFGTEAQGVPRDSSGGIASR